MLRKYARLYAPDSAAGIADPPAVPSAPASTPGPATPDAGSTSFESNFDARFAEESEPVKPVEPAPSAPAQTTPKENATPTKAKAASKPAAAPKADDPDALPKEFAESRDLKQIREFATRQHKTAKTLEREKAELQSRLQQLEAVVPQSQSEKAALSKKVSEMEKRISDYEERIQLVDFRQSDRYRNDFEKPYVDAFTAGVNDIKQCQVAYEHPTEKEDDGITPKRMVRPGTERDLQYILSLDRVTARREAKKYFPEDWENVMDNYNSITPLRDKIISEEKNLQGKWKQIQEEQEAARVAEENQTGEEWQKVNDTLIANNPVFSERKDDAEGNELLRKGYELADAFFSDERTKLPLQKRVRFDALIRNMAAAYPRLVSDLKKRDAQIEQLQAEINQLRGSTPGAPAQAGGETQTSGDESKTVMDRFEEKV